MPVNTKDILNGCGPAVVEERTPMRNAPEAGWIELFYPLGSLSTAWLSVTGSLAPLLTPMAINPRAALALIGRTQEGLATKGILEERIEAAERLEPDPQPQMTSPLEKEPADEDFIT